MKIINRKFIIIFVFLILAAGLIFVLSQKSTVVVIENQSASLGIKTTNQEQKEEWEQNPISGLACENYQRRPIAVVLAEDPITRPLAGISQADLVFEMPVITGSITRMIGVFVCDLPDEIGSLRSARHDFIPLLMGLDAILVHWGGSHFALDKLNAGIMDNIDALKNPFNAFFQKSGIPMPHNGFSSGQRLLNSAEKLGYRMENEFEGYPHSNVILEGAERPIESRSKQQKILKIDYSYPYNVEYRYDSESNSYLRWRAGKAEIDKNNNQQVRAKNIVVMRVASKQIEGPDYNDLDLEGSGKCQVYQNGQVIDCTWHKSEIKPTSKLRFLDKDGEEIPFVPGQIWIELVEPGQTVSWK